MVTAAIHRKKIIVWLENSTSMQFYAKKVSVAAASFKIERLNYNLVEVSFALTAAEFEETLPIIEIIFGMRKSE